MTGARLARMKLDASIAYPEASTIALTGALQARGSLGTVYAPATLARLSRLAARSLSRNPTTPLVQRAAAWDFDVAIDAAVEDTGSVAMIGLALLRRMPRTERLAARAMYAAKHGFDRKVARARRDSANGVLGIQGSSALTFRDAQPGFLRVLNHVNGHPEVHNEALRVFAGLMLSHHEMIPRSALRRAATETALADLVIVPSNGVMGQLVARGVDAGRILVAPYGVDSLRFRPSGAPLDGPMRCLYVGQISHRKGVGYLCEAARRLPTIGFDLIGPMVSPEILHGAPSNVRWLGVSSHGHLAGSFVAYQVFVLPSLEDSFGLVAAEAAACGLPVVVSQAAGASEVLAAGGAATVVRPASAAALAEAIEELADDVGLRTEMGARGRSISVTTLTWARFTEAVLSALDARC